MKPGQPRNLTEHERRAIALQAGSGDIEGAISRYLLLRAPDDTKEAFLQAPTINDALDEIADPGLAKIVREAVWLVGKRESGVLANSGARSGHELRQSESDASAGADRE